MHYFRNLLKFVPANNRSPKVRPKEVGMLNGTCTFILLPPQILSLDETLVLYGYTMHPARLCGGFWTIKFFSCLVFRLAWKKDSVVTDTHYLN